ncbi:hypothetical protein BDR26DRAFT_866606 [Obelidium mucronatum]|nr:hypothetical protein BDR26DRAFT_866606 [Obelidium mucronatum]
MQHIEELPADHVAIKAIFQRAQFILNGVSAGSRNSLHILETGMNNHATTTRNHPAVFIQSTSAKNTHLVSQRNPTEGAFKCHICPAAFSNSNDLIAHGHSHVIANRKTDVISCQKCGDRFPSVTDMMVHQQHAHTVVRPFKCNKCSKAFTEAKYLKRHVNGFHAEAQF